MKEALLQDKRILVIEDIEENMRLCQAILKLDGAIVWPAFNAPDGIALARSGQPDLILMDIQMPDMDGLTATRLLRADPLTAAIPIVAITASVMPDDLQETIEAGCDGYITKPLEPSQFARQLLPYLKTEADA